VRTLARLAHEEGGVRSQDGLVLRRRPTQQELANMVGSSRETVSRTLAAMARQGLAVPRGRSLVLTEQLLRRGMVTAQA
jgi:CRP-like cAMP-binding protein